MYKLSVNEKKENKIIELKKGMKYRYREFPIFTKYHVHSVINMHYFIPIHKNLNLKWSFFYSNFTIRAESYCNNVGNHNNKSGREREILFLLSRNI